MRGELHARLWRRLPQARGGWELAVLSEAARLAPCPSPGHHSGSAARQRDGWHFLLGLPECEGSDHGRKRETQRLVAWG